MCSALSPGFVSDGEEASFYQCETCGLRCLTSHGLERHKLKCEQFNDDATEQGSAFMFLYLKKFLWRNTSSF